MLSKHNGLHHPRKDRAFWSTSSPSAVAPSLSSSTEMWGARSSCLALVMWYKFDEQTHKNKTLSFWTSWERLCTTTFLKPNRFITLSDHIHLDPHVSIPVLSGYHFELFGPDDCGACRRPGRWSLQVPAIQTIGTKLPLDRHTFTHVQAQEKRR